MTARELFDKWKGAVFPGQESELEFRNFRPGNDTVHYVDRRAGTGERSCMITTGQMDAQIKVAQAAEERK
jgi:hypothetical protein